MKQTSEIKKQDNKIVGRQEEQDDHVDQARKKAQAAEELGFNLDESQYLTFMADADTFAFELKKVKEIIAYRDVTIIPRAPSFIRGVINLRGNVLPVIDLAARFGRKRSKITKLTCVIVTEVDSEGEKTEVGLMVDGVNEVINLPEKRIELPPSFGARIRSEFIDGIGKIDEKFIMILQLDKVVDLEELGSFEENSVLAASNNTNDNKENDAKVSKRSSKPDSQNSKKEPEPEKEKLNA